MLKMDTKCNSRGLGEGSQGEVGEGGTDEDKTRQYEYVASFLITYVKKEMT